MPDTSTTLLLAAGAGFLTGMRSMTPIAAISRHLAKRNDHDDVLLGPLGRPLTATLLGAAAAGELVADKLPFVPARTDPPSLVARTVLGGLCGAAVARYRTGSAGLDTTGGGAVAGALAAAVSTFLVYHARREAGARTGVPDPLVGGVEDAVVLASTAGLVEALDA